MIRGGFVGVDVFFVISGYLIGGIIYREVRAGRFSFAQFYARRARRILPALLTVLAFCAVLGPLLLTPNELQRFSGDAVATLFAVSNIAFLRATDYFSPSAEYNPLLMTWSLGVEEQYYLFVPVLILIVFKLWRRHIFLSVGLITTLSFGLSLWTTERHPTAAFFLLPARAWELGVGMLLVIGEIRFSGVGTVGRYRLSNITGLLGIALVAVAVLTYSDGTPFPGAWALAPVLGSSFLIVSRESFLNRVVLSWPPIVFIGQISYSWYLWHWPLLSFARAASDGPLNSTATACVIASSFVAAFLSWRYVEKRFRFIRRPYGSTLRGYSLALGTLGIVLLSLGLNHGLSRRFSPELGVIERNGKLLSSSPCIVSYGATKPNLSPSCSHIEMAGDTLALAGDSHAGALAAAMRDLVEQRGMNFVQLTKSSCPTLIDVTRRMPNHPFHERECAVFNARVFKLLLGSRSIKTVVLAGYWSAPIEEAQAGSRFVLTSQSHHEVTAEQSLENLAIGLADTIETLTRAGKHVILVQDVPIYRFDPLRHVEAQYIPSRRSLSALLSTRLQIGQTSALENELQNYPDVTRAILSSVAARFPNTAVLDLQRAFCTQGRCVFAKGPNVYYDDNQHLSLQGAQLAMRSLAFQSKLK